MRFGVGIGMLAIGSMLATVRPAAADPVSPAILLDNSLFAGTSATVSYDPNAPESNFQAPTNASDAIGYTISLRTDGTNVYGILVTNPSGGGSAVGTFANVYWDLDPQNNNGSDLGFELGANSADAFIPGVNGSVNTPEVSVATTTEIDNAIEFGFAIPVSDFTSPIAGLDYYPSQVFPDAANPDITLRLSQSFGYSVAGGSSYGTDRLGTLDIIPTSVPEPASLSLLGVGLAALPLFRRRKRI